MNYENSAFGRLAGGVLLAFGVALTGLGQFVVERQFTFNNALALTPVCILLALGLIGFFCIIVGCRLAFNLPNRYQSILSPFGWYAMTLLFATLGAGVATVLLREGQHGLLVGCSASFTAFVVMCVKAGRGAAHRGTGAKAKSPVFARDTQLHRMTAFGAGKITTGIEIFNDDTTPMEFVVGVLAQHLQIDRESAVKLMLGIHREGGLVVPLEDLERSEGIAAAITLAARENGHQLICRAFDS